MFCPKCGTQAPDGTRFCPKCGNALGGGQPAAQPSAQPAAPQAPQAAPQGVAYTPVAPAAPAKGANKGLVIGLAVAAVAIVAAIVFGLVSCMGGTNYVGTWEGSASYQGISVDCTLTLNDDKSAEMEMSALGQSETMDGLEWRESDKGVEVSPEGEDDWVEFEKEGNALHVEQDGVEFELEKK